MKTPTSIPLAFMAAAMLLPGQEAAAFTEGGVIQRLSHIETVVTPNLDGTYTYDYRVVNDSPGPQFLGGFDAPESQVVFDGLETWPAIVGYEIPLDHPSVVSGILSPATWDHRFLSAADYLLEYGVPNSFNSLYVLQWYDAQFGATPPATMIVPDGFNARFGASEYEPHAEGFSMVSNLAPVDGPYANLWTDLERNIGDPPLPGGATGARALPFNPIPEVPGQGFAGLALLGLAVVLRWRRAR